MSEYSIKTYGKEMEIFYNLDIDEYYNEIYISEEIKDDYDIEMQSNEILTTMSKQIIVKSVTTKFIQFIYDKEIKYFTKGFCKKYFNVDKFPSMITEIVNMSQDDVWNIDCAYGLIFQAFLAHESNLELPCLKQRKRKYPIIKRKLITHYKSQILFDKDPIYEEVSRNCKRTISDSYKRKSPRNQILIHIFILDLLLHPYYKYCMKWYNKQNLTFEIINPRVIAHIWMTIKGNDTCSYEHFARGIRFKRGKGKMFIQTETKNRLVYQFTKNAISDYRLKRHNNDLAMKLFSENFPNHI